MSDKGVQGGCIGFLFLVCYIVLIVMWPIQDPLSIPNAPGLAANGLTSLVYLVLFLCGSPILSMSLRRKVILLQNGLLVLLLQDLLAYFYL